MSQTITIISQGNGSVEGLGARFSPLKIGHLSIPRSRALVPFQLQVGTYLFQLRGVGVDTNQVMAVFIYNNGHLILERKGRPNAIINETITIEDLPPIPLIRPDAPPPTNNNILVFAHLYKNDELVRSGEFKLVDLEALDKRIWRFEIIEEDEVNPDINPEDHEVDPNEPFIIINGIKYLADPRKIRDQSIPTRDKILKAGNGDLVQVDNILRVELKETLSFAAS